MLDKHPAQTPLQPGVGLHPIQILAIQLSHFNRYPILLLNENG